MAITESQLEELLLKIALDPSFRKVFKKNPRRALDNLNIKVTRDEMDQALALASDLIHYPSRAVKRVPIPEPVLGTTGKGPPHMHVGPPFHNK